MGMIMINEVEHNLNADLIDRIRRIKHIALDMDGTIYNENEIQVHFLLQSLERS